MKEALTLALDWLESGNFVYPTELRTDIKEALAHDEDAIIIQYHEATIKILEKRIEELTAQPEQEPVAWEQFHEHLVERNFCPRCGKRTADLTTIHTCTPPQEKNV